MGFSYKCYDVKVPSMEGFSSNVVDYQYVNNSLNKMNDSNNDSDAEVLNMESNIIKTSYDMNINRLISNYLKFRWKLMATEAVVCLSLVEGLGEFGEVLGDTGCVLDAACKTPFVWAADKAAGLFGYDTNFTKKMWDNTKSYVAKEQVKGAFDKFYDGMGHSLKENAIGFDVTRGLGSGVGYVGGVIALTVFTCGTGTAAGVAGGTTMSQGMGVIGAAGGFGRGAERAWNDGASTLEGLKYATRNAAWEGTQFYLGGKIGEFGGLGDQVATKILGQNAPKIAGSVSRVFLDSIDGGAEGFVQPLLAKAYKGGTYKELFEESGGWKSVGIQTVLGAGLSSVGEFGNLRRYFYGKDTKVVDNTIDKISSEYKHGQAPSFTNIDDRTTILPNFKGPDGDGSVILNKKIIDDSIATKNNIYFDFVKTDSGFEYKRWNDYEKYLEETVAERSRIHADMSPQDHEFFRLYGTEDPDSLCDYSTMNSLLRGNFLNIDDNGIIKSYNAYRTRGSFTFHLGNLLKHISKSRKYGPFSREVKLQSVSDVISYNKKAIDNISSFLYNHTLDEPMITYRGFTANSGPVNFLGFDPTGMTLEEFEKNLFEQGDGFITSGFLSSSVTLNKTPARAGRIGFVLYNPTGTPGIHVLNSFDDEQEFLIAPNIKYNYKKVEEVNGRFLIHCEIDPSFDFKEAQIEFYKNLEKQFDEYLTIAKKTDSFVANNSEYFKSEKWIGEDIK